MKHWRRDGEALQSALARDGYVVVRGFLSAAEAAEANGRIERYATEVLPGLPADREPNHALTLWLALDRVDEENGCVRDLPGSHAQGMRPHRSSGILGFSQGIDGAAAPAQLNVALLRILGRHQSVAITGGVGLNGGSEDFSVGTSWRIAR